MQIRDEEEARERAEEIPVYFYLFDLLHLDGHDVTQLPLRTWKRILRAQLEWEDPIRYPPLRVGEGKAYLREACEKGWEGLIAKEGDGAYVHIQVQVRESPRVRGGRVERTQGRAGGPGALLVGYHEDGALRYAGKVGTGFTDEVQERLRSRLRELERGSPPFAADDLPRGGVHWAEPKLVCEVGFTKWTEDGKLRHPRFLWLREDKDPEDVVRDRPDTKPEEAE